MARVAAILGTFTVSDAGIPVAEIARRAGLARSTTSRLVGQLTAAGLLQRDGSRVHLGLQLFELGQLVPVQRTLRAAVSPFLHDLRDATRHTANLAILDGSDIVYLDRVPGPNSAPMPFRPGGRHPAHATALGKAIMAHAPAEVVDVVCGAGLGALTAHTLTTRQALERELDEARRTGLAFDRQETRLGVFCVASPIFGRDGAVLAAISVTDLRGPSAITRFGPAVRNAALNLSRTLMPTRGAY
ncbi:IclR family transcriptional regulator [Ornithinimicrobium cavernae]|uniref:IclR family transcriptional regulator n=1 Tax=Ornithinimicrobium cavernae TaxID=2666047 RepID=UPI001379D8A6|nr:IclR family transcriptional regulator [Ornithinimicrobium cavernae]